MLAYASASVLGYALDAPKTRLKAAFNQPADAVLACPATKAPLATERSVIGSVERTFKLSTDEGVRYPINTIYADLLPSAGRADSSAISTQELVQELRDAWDSRTKTQLFRSPLTAFLYERGWREGFKNAGFPGIDAEFAEVDEFFRPAAGGVVVDMSCGSGLMTRRLASSGKYGRVLALDYSEAMLGETRRRLREQQVTPMPELYRADVASLPLQTGSVDAMHAGAAMHCWPQLEEGLREIRRALKPGGVFFATTFYQGAYGVPMADDGGGGSFRFFEDEAELVSLFVGAGFPAELLEVRREGRGCAIIKAGVPAATGEVGVVKGVPTELEAPAEAVAVEVVDGGADGGDALPTDLDFIPGDLE